MKKYLLLLVLLLLGVIWSRIHCYNPWHWIGEMLPVILGVTILIKTFNRFRFTYLTYVVVLISCFFILIGAKYTFSRVPFFLELTRPLGFERNNFDKVGHFLQGVLPVLISRELFLRKGVLKKSWVGFISFCMALATTATYEIIEYITCLIAGKNIESFVGTQGFFWDTHTDMLAALLGALFVLLFLSRFHNSMMRKEFNFFVSN